MSKPYTRHPKQLVLSLLAVLSMSNSFANLPRSVTLTKTGGNDTLFTTGIVLPNGHTSTAPNNISWKDSASAPIINWTDIFVAIDSIVDEDNLDNYLPNVSYQVSIVAPLSTDPIMVGWQNLSYPFSFASSGVAMDFHNDYPSHRINGITLALRC